MERISLKHGQILKLTTSPGSSSTEEYQIMELVGQGGATLCYEAVRVQDGVVGKLKEYYPIEFSDSLVRLENGQLIPCAGAIRTFPRNCQDYLKNVYRLNSVIRENPHNQLLKNYIPVGDILYGSAEDVPEKYRADGTTVYIWTPGLAGQCFDNYLTEISNSPQKAPEKTLYTIINTLITLTECTAILHSAGLLHLDIKPSNFLVPYAMDFSLKSGVISVFDINTLHAIGDGLPTFCGTPGFCAPEIRADAGYLQRKRTDYHADIYSIGATLFHAVVIPKTGTKLLYRPEYEAQLPQMLRSSLLIKNSEMHNDIHLLSGLLTILRKCLKQEPSLRYDGCHFLLEDLKSVKQLLLPYVNHLGNNRKLAWVPVDEPGISDPVLVMRKLLYDVPLYSGIKGTEKKLRVVVIGCGIYGQKFMDIALEAGQMWGYDLNIHAYSGAWKMDKERYLQFRPDLERLVTVEDGQILEKDAFCGALRFLPLPGNQEQFSQSNKDLNAVLVKEIVQAENPNYVFVALGKTRLNRQVAGLFSELLSECPVCYVDNERKNMPAKLQAYAPIPVCVRVPITPETIDPQLEQMSFNTHLIWNPALNDNRSKALKNFRKDKYSFDASLAFALSIPYKLYSIGLLSKKEWRGSGFPNIQHLEEAVLLFQQQILDNRFSDKAAREKYDMLVALEHRRWMISKLTDGWTVPIGANGKLRLDDCVKAGKAKLDALCQHACLVPSRAESPLFGDSYIRDNFAKWDDKNIDPALDPLDRMSLELHQRFQKAADLVRASAPMQNESVIGLGKLVSEHPELDDVYRQYLFCLKNILNKEKHYAAQHDYYADKLSEETTKLSPEVQDTCTHLLAQIKHLFLPVIESCLCRNYKALDEDLVLAIPYIVTFRNVSVLAMAFEDGASQNGRNEAVFANVASATVLHPQKLCYLYCVTKETDVVIFRRKVLAILRYFNSRNLHCEISFAVSCTWDASQEQRDAIRASLSEAAAQKNSTVYVSDFQIFECDFTLNASEQFLSYLKEQNVTLFDGSTRLFRSQLENSMFTRLLLEQRIPYCEFLPGNQTFSIHVGCEFLRFVSGNAFIRVIDMFSLMDAHTKEVGFPELAEDYETLWEIYTGCYLERNSFSNGILTWNNLCKCLEEYEKDRGILGVFSKPSVNDLQTLTVYCPQYTVETVKRLLSQMEELGVVSSGWVIEASSGENCRVQLQTYQEYAEQMKLTFSKPQFLMPYYGVHAQKDADTVRVMYHCLNAERVNLNTFEKGQHLLPLLKALEENGFIHNLMQHEDRFVVSFAYTSPCIKKLLTKGGELLEIYTYFSVLKTGFFDDAVWSYGFQWSEGNVSNELDLVLTKGFRSFIIECKATAKLDMTYYHKLHSIAEHFGIGTTKILIGNTYQDNQEKCTQTASANDRQRSRGEQLNIITFSDEEDIQNIGEVLADLAFDK